ncbi:hypothetical protein NC652_029802 [Populus alba x Populus x berolinensis]|nr:hypothetical protein NC652_029802 [Populus alba x Populus x berolinensis]
MWFCYHKQLTEDNCRMQDQIQNVEQRRYSSSLNQFDIAESSKNTGHAVFSLPYLPHLNSYCLFKILTPNQVHLLKLKNFMFRNSVIAITACNSSNNCRMRNNQHEVRSVGASFSSACCNGSSVTLLISISFSSLSC